MLQHRHVRRRETEGGDAEAEHRGEGDTREDRLQRNLQVRPDENLQRERGDEACNARHPLRRGALLHPEQVANRISCTGLGLRGRKCVDRCGTEGERVEQTQEGEDVHDHEMAVVPRADAVATERAVVIHPERTPLAEAAVMRSRRLPVSTVVAPIWSVQQRQVRIDLRHLRPARFVREHHLELANGLVGRFDVHGRAGVRKLRHRKIVQELDTYPDGHQVERQLHHDPVDVEAQHYHGHEADSAEQWNYGNNGQSEQLELRRERDPPAGLASFRPTTQMQRPCRLRVSRRVILGGFAIALVAAIAAAVSVGIRSL
mmetsp:Transcript_108798/g.347260  ORF Transcript_108798/g.347260 Transcript_108798/m.347260 type:complete len:316 (+) Transcript_108798:389-1336(+)